MRSRASRPASTRRRTHRRTALAAALLVSVGLAGCSSAGDSTTSPDEPAAEGATESARPDPVRLTTSFQDARKVPVDAPVRVGATGGTQVTASAPTSRPSSSSSCPSRSLAA